MILHHRYNFFFSPSPGRKPDFCFGFLKDFWAHFTSLILEPLLRFGNTCPCKEAGIVQPLGAVWSSHVLVCRLPLPFRVVNYGNTDLQCSSRRGAWRISVVCGEFSKHLSAELCVYMYICLGNMSGGFMRVQRTWNLK